MLSGDLNQRITQGMNDLMSSVSSQIQRAIRQAIKEQIQATLRSGQGQVPNRRWEVLSRRQECRSEEALNRQFRSSSRDKLPSNFDRNEDLENTHEYDLIMT